MGSGVAIEAISPVLQRFYDQDIAWVNCGDAECARVEVPVDYAQPEAGSLELGVSRVAATGERLGSLIVNPGGPGASATNYAKHADVIVGDPVREHFDVVGVDPRGVATSEPIECLTDEQRDELLELDGTPSDAAGEQQIIDGSAALGERCRAAEPKLLAHVGTVEAARDLDIVRAALGDSALNYLGKSYGTQLGATYAELFPGRVGRMVLDGVLPAGHSVEDITHAQALEFEIVLDEFIADCLQHDDCPLEGTVPQAKQQLLNWRDSLDASPIDVDGRLLNDALASYAILSNLYFVESDFPLLRNALRAAIDERDGAPLLDLLDSRISRGPDGTYLDNSTDAYYAVTCLDRPYEGTVEGVRSLAAQWRVESPAFGESLAWGLLACQNWPAQADRLSEVRAEGANPILVVSATTDPATPYAWAEDLARALESGHLVTWDATNHTAYGQGSGCIDEVVDQYLVVGALPKAGLVCD